MAIVPFKLWEDMKRWKEEQIQKPRLPPDPNVSATISLQRDLSSVLANEDLSEGEKSQLYGQTLHQFQTAHRKALENNKLQLSISSKINQRINDSVPTTMKKKARLLMSMLQDHPNLSWDEDGTVKMYGQPIPGTNIIDLVNDVLRQVKEIEPTGWQPFAEGLKAMNVPQDFVGNKKMGMDASFKRIGPSIIFSSRGGGGCVSDTFKIKEKEVTYHSQTQYKKGEVLCKTSIRSSCLVKL